MPDTRLFYVTDIHGSDLCFRKFISSITSDYEPNVIIIGGDISGKIIVPIVEEDDHWHCRFQRELKTFKSDADADAFLHYLAERGQYGYKCSQTEKQRLDYDVNFQLQVARDLMIARLRQWVEWSDRYHEGTPVKIIVNTGNDDPPFLDDVLHQSRSITFAEAQVIPLDDYLTLVSTSYVPTPPRSDHYGNYRTLQEPELRARIAAITTPIKDWRKCIFNFHCPPYGTHLDRALAPLDDATTRYPGLSATPPSGGSTAIRDAIETLSPCVSLHGHIHECHAFQIIGNTLAFNPGTEYFNGMLAGVFLEFRKGTLVDYYLTREDGTAPDPRGVSPLWHLLDVLLGPIPLVGPFFKKGVELEESRRISAQFIYLENGIEKLQTESLQQQEALIKKLADMTTQIAATTTNLPALQEAVALLAEQQKNVQERIEQLNKAIQSLQTVITKSHKHKSKRRKAP